MNGMHDLYHGQSGLRIQHRPPGRFKFLKRKRIIHALVVGQHHWYQACVGGPLYIILPAQWMQAGSRPADLTTQQTQTDQAARIIRAMDMLRDAHAPENNGVLCLRIQTRHLANFLRGYATHRRHALGRIVHHILLDQLKIGSALSNKFLVNQLLFDHSKQHGIQQRHIRIRFKLQKMIRCIGQFNTPGIDHHQGCSGALFLFDKRSRYGVVAGGVRANHQNQVCVSNIFDLIGNRTRTHAFE